MVPYHGFELLIFTCFNILKNLEGVNFSSPVLQVSQVQKRQRTFPSSLSKLGQENRNYLYKVPRIIKFIDSESTLVDARGWGGGEWEGGLSV